MIKDIKATVYSTKGEKAGEINLPAIVFGRELNKKSLSQTVVALQKNRRVSKAHAKDRSDISGGGRKPWRQKGTGRARHGSIRSPIWRGGGVTHGPSKQRKYSTKINSKIKNQSLSMALSEKLNSKELIIVNSIEISAPKTKILAETVKAILPKDESSSTLIVLAERNENITRASRNIPKLRVMEGREVSVLDVLSVKNIIFEKEAIKAISDRVS